MKFYFTFGFVQVHQNGFHVIEAENYNEARQKMVRRFGMKWSMQYTEEEWFKDGMSMQERYQLHEVK